MKRRPLAVALLGAMLLAGGASAAQNGTMMQGQGQGMMQGQGGPGSGMGYGHGYGMGYGMMSGGMVGGGMGCMGAYGHTDGMLAFYKAELAITPAQESVWTPFAAALRKQADDMASRPFMHRGWWNGQMGPGMMWQGQDDSSDTQTMPDALDAHIKWAEAHLADMKALSAAAKPLYQALSDDQKTKANGLFGGGMCGF